MSLIRCCSALTLTLLLSSGCMSRLSHQSEDPQAQAVVQGFVKQLARGSREGVMELVSTPFWIEKWIVDPDIVRMKMPGEAEEGLEDISKLIVRIYPVQDLAALKPETWARLQAGDTDQLKDLYVAAVGLYFEDDDPEDGLLLLRRVDGNWRLAGLIEE